jgi:HD-like signal output (HDOD) protein
VNPLDSRDREKRFGKIFRVTAELAAILDKLSVSESRQLRDVSGAADLVGLKEQLDLVGAAAEQASYSSSKKITQDRKDQAFYTMIWSMSKLLPADAERKTKARFLVECLDRLGLFASELSDNQKYLKIKDLLRKNQKIFGS